MSCVHGTSSSSSPSLIEIFGSSTEILSSLISASSTEERVVRRMMGVSAGDGIGEGNGVGISLMGERHLLIVLGISKSIVGGCSRLLPQLDDLCALSGSRTGTSMVLWWCMMGLSGAPLENDTGDVDDSSSPAISSCGDDAVGVVDGDTFSDGGKFTPAELVEKFRNIARIESALAGFCLPAKRLPCPALTWPDLSKSDTLELSALGIARSELVNESLPWLLEVLLGERASTFGDGGVLEGRAAAPANTHPSRPLCMIPNSISEPELISADTLFSNRAKVTFFSSLGSLRAVWRLSPPNFVSFVASASVPSVFCSFSFSLRSLICISSPRLTLRESCLLLGEMSCWRICFFSAAFFLVGVELLRFFFGEGVPGRYAEIVIEVWLRVGTSHKPHTIVWRLLC